MKISTLPFMTLILCGLAACSGHKTPAPIVDYGAGEGAGSAGVHIVSEGDTAWDIAQRYNISMRHMLDKNNLIPPYNLRVGQRLKLPPPSIYKVKRGDSLYQVSLVFDVSVTRLARANALRDPFTVHPGDELRVPYAGSGHNIANRSKPTSRARVQKASVSSHAPRNYTAPARSSSRFMRPVSGRVISRFGPKKGGLHNDGINIKAPRGAPVRAAENGVVMYTGDDLKGYGNLVLIKHGGGYVTAYAHMGKILVKRGQKLNAGETVGTVGSTGQVNTPQLHFEIRKGSRALDPQKYLAPSA